MIVASLCLQANSYPGEQSIGYLTCDLTIWFKTTGRARCQVEPNVHEWLDAI